MSDAFWNRARDLVKNDIRITYEKDTEYGSSWKSRGGIGAFMMLARKWDRIEVAMEEEGVFRYDIFERTLLDAREEGILDDIGDLRRYLMLVETELRMRMEAKAALIPAMTEEGAKFVGIEGFSFDRSIPFSNMTPEKIDMGVRLGQIVMSGFGQPRWAKNEEGEPETTTEHLNDR